MSISPGINNSHSMYAEKGIRWPLGQILTDIDNSNQLTTVKTSKTWVLPPRPKPGRKPTNEKIETCKEKKRRPKNSPTIIEEKSASSSPQASQLPIQPASKQQITGLQQSSRCQSIPKQQKQPTCVGKGEIHELNKNISIIEKENSQLKTHLLSLIHDYKHLKNLVLNKPQSLPHHLAFEDTTTARKRSFTELVNVDPMNELICNMSDLSYSPITTGASNIEPSSPIEDTDSELDEVFNYINLDNYIYDEDGDEEDEDTESLELSRTTSPSLMSETDGENSLMTTLTRSTTVSTNNSMMNEKRIHKDEPFKFYSLPEFSTKDYEFSFDEINPNDKKMSIIQEDKYNMITDFLEEKLIDNDLNYYVQNESFKH